MNKLLLSGAALGLSFSSFAQLPVSTTPQNRKVLLEEFTGMFCQWCPQGHKIANELKASKPAGAVVLVNIHTGGFANPGPGDPDFRTPEGNAIAAITGTNIQGYPTGSINRHKFVGQSGFAINRGDWARYADSTLAKTAYVNVALQGTLNLATRVLTVNVEAYYTANSPVSTNKLTVALLEDSVRGPQTNGSVHYPEMMNPDGTYNHNHMLRKVLTTAATGEVITTTTAGTTVTKTYTYTVPALYVNNMPNLQNLHLAAFVTETDSEVITAAGGPITVTGADSKITMTSPLNGSVFCSATTVPNKVILKNTGSVPLTSADIYYKVGSAAYQVYNWTATTPLAIGAVAEVTLGNITVSDFVTVKDSVGRLNGQAEYNPANSVATCSVAGQTASSALPVASSFENGLAAGWLPLDDAGKVTNGAAWFTATQANITAYDGSYVAVAANMNLDPNKKSTLVLPYTTMPAGAKALDFYYAYAMRGSVSDKLEVVYSIDCGTTWQSLWSKTGTDLATTAATPQDSYFLPSNKTQYKFVSLDISAISGNAMVGFRTTSNQGSYTWIDKVNMRTGTPTTGLNELINETSISLYPNPVSDQLNVELNIVKSTNVTFSVINVIGQQIGQPVVKNLSQGQSKVTIATNSLAPGVYFLNIATDKGSVQRKFVKQ